jgi:hypothetical protein
VYLRNERDNLFFKSQAQEKEIARLRLALMETDAQLRQLGKAHAHQQRELLRANQDLQRLTQRMQTLIGEPEAAALIAEVEVSLDYLGDDATPAARRQARSLLDASTAAFANGDYPSAGVLADQALRLVESLRDAQTRPTRGAAASPEIEFAMPVRFSVRVNSHLRDGPGSRFPVRTTLPEGSRVTASASKGQWVRVVTDEGTRGWIFRRLLAEPQ